MHSERRAPIVSGMKELREAPVAISVAHLGLLLDLSVPAAYALAGRLDAFALPGTKKGKRVLLGRIREHLGDAVADEIAARLTRSIPASAGPVLLSATVPGLDAPGGTGRCRGDGT